MKEKIFNLIQQNNLKLEQIQRQTNLDLQEIEKILEELMEERMIFLNTLKGEQLFDEIKDFTVYKKTIAEVALKNNWAAIKSSYRPVKRKKFMKNIENTDFKTLCLTCKNKTLTERIIFKLKSKLKF